MDQKDTPTEEQMWFKIMNIWLNNKLNKVLVKHDLTEATNHPYVIMRGLSMRKKPHTCIYDNQFINFFDPHPTKEGLSEFHYYLTIENL
jgi:ABC-type nitrate/sulfonate/bicarbonate transport system ATPase subunit